MHGLTQTLMILYSHLAPPLPVVLLLERHIDSIPWKESPKYDSLKGFSYSRQKKHSG